MAQIVSLSVLSVAAAGPAEPPWSSKGRDAFVVSLATDHDGGLWIGTEDQGVCRLDPASGEWRQFTAKQGLGDDNAYAVACDKAGRVWVGHLNHGVSVYNGETWRNYGVLDGPLGERVFDIAAAADGDVWVATNHGLTRYRSAVQRWEDYTGASGLSDRSVTSIAFDDRGALYVGTSAGGLSIARRADDYRVWRTVGGVAQPIPTGSAHDQAALPSPMVTKVMVARDGAVYVGTPQGLGISRDGGKTWEHRRGKDWADKVRGRLGGVITGWKEEGKPALSEDYVTGLAEDDQGRVWVGHRATGYDVCGGRPFGTLWSVAGAAGARQEYVRVLLPRKGTTPLVGLYGGGLVEGVLARDVASKPAPPVQLGAAHHAVPALPAVQRAPDLADLNRMLADLAKVVPGRAQDGPVLAALPDDWLTQGDWLGRYGRYWACLYACDSPQDYFWGAGARRPVSFNAIGPNRSDYDAPRYWVHWLYSDNPRVLELPPVYLDSRVRRNLTTWAKGRRQSEIDDHGEVYPMTKDGPHLLTNLRIPEGLFVLSLYDHNKDGHSGTNRWRDYGISLREHPKSKSITESPAFDTRPELARGRIHDFWGGVWKRFLVRGPVTLTYQVNRNNSFNTILAGAMLDSVDELPAPYFGDSTEQERLYRQREEDRQGYVGEWPLSPPTLWRVRRADSEREAADRLFAATERWALRNAAWHAAEARRLYRPLALWYQHAVDTPADRQPDDLRRLATCYYQMGLYARWEETLRVAGLQPARDVEKALRWDGQTDRCTGRGKEWVTRYVAAQQQAAAAKP